LNNIVKRFTNKMGMYLSQNSVTEESLMDCKTKEEYAAYYIKFNDLHPNEYFKLAKTKLKDSKRKAELFNAIDTIPF